MIRPGVQIVVNPRSGNGQALAIARRLESELSARGHPIATLVVEELAEATRWANACRGGFGYLFCIGGDSTLSEIAPAALRLSVPLVPVPVGFGNIFAHTFGHRARRRDLLRLLEGGDVHWVDVGVAADGVFLSSRSFGFLEQVKQAVETQSNLPSFPLLRYLSYVRSAIRILRDTPLPRMHAHVDGVRIADEAPVVIVANVPTYRGFLNLTPQATPLDGALDVFVPPRTSKLGLVALLLTFLLHVPGRWKRVCYRRGERVSVASDEARREELCVLPAALPVLMPAGWLTHGLAPARLAGEILAPSPEQVRERPLRAALEGTFTASPKPDTSDA